MIQDLLNGNYLTVGQRSSHGQDYRTDKYTSGGVSNRNDTEISKHTESKWFLLLIDKYTLLRNITNKPNNHIFKIV